MLLTVERVTALQRVDLFSEVPGRTLAAVARHAAEVVAEAGTTFIVQGSVEDHLFVIVEGRVKVHRGDRTLAELGAWSTVGELAALVPEPRNASVTAVERTMLLRVDKLVLDELIADRPALASGIITALVQRLRRAQADPDFAERTEVLR